MGRRLSIRRLGTLGATCLVVGGAASAGPSAAAASGPTIDLVSGSKSQPAYFDGASQDGKRVYFLTQARLTRDDSGREWDLYRWSSGRLERVSRGPAGGHAASADAGPEDALGAFRGESADGRRVLLTTDQRLTSDDRNFSLDSYEWSRRGVRLVSTRRRGAMGLHQVVYLVGASTDLKRVLLTTDQRLTPTDRDNKYDVFERTGSSTVLLSPPPVSGTNHDMEVEAVSADRRRVLVRTLDRLTGADVDGQPDLYLLQAGQAPRLVSTGPAGGNGPYPAFPAYPSAPAHPFSVSQPYDPSVLAADGGRVFFSTVERLTPDDRDNSEDIYEWDDGTVRLISTAPNRGNGEVGPSPQTFGYELVASDDGLRVHFTTPEQLTADDVDAGSDLYVRADGATSLESLGPAGGNGAMPEDDLFFAKSRLGHFFSADDALRTSGDGTRVFFSTVERLTGDDTDANRDVYVRIGGRLQRVSTGPVGGNGHRAAVLEGISHDGHRVFFSTTEPLTADDRDRARDVYEWRDGVTTRVSGSGRLGNGPFGSRFVGVTDDGRCVFFETLERLAHTDRDRSSDIYRSCSE